MWQMGAYPENKKELYQRLILELQGIMEDEADLIANLANASALIFNALKDINWAGFYLMKDGMLVLGPFQGKPACIRIPVGRGVCGTAVKEKEIQLVYDVHKFPGHIACDEASNSEIVIPLIVGEEVKGVLDIDSPLLGRFGFEDLHGLAALCQVLVEGCNWK